jgi:eukaryotic translation initiation factor 2C
MSDLSKGATAADVQHGGPPPPSGARGRGATGGTSSSGQQSMRGSGPTSSGQNRGGPPGGRGGGAFGGNASRGRGGPPEIFSQGASPLIDARINTSESAVARFKGVSNDPANPLRPGFGKLGQEVILRANFFAVKIAKKSFFEYRVDISPKPKSQESERIFQLLEAHPQFQTYQNHIAHDSASRLVCSRKLPQPLNLSIEFYYDQIPATSHPRLYKLSIVDPRELDTEVVTR